MDISSCSHTLGVLSDMEVTSVTPEYTKRECTICHEVEYLPRAGKIRTGYNIKAEGFRDSERRQYAKDLLQPKDRKGKVDELYNHAWGSPYKKSKIGSKTDQYIIKDEK